MSRPTEAIATTAASNNYSGAVLWASARGFRADDPEPLGPPEEVPPPGSDLTSISAAMELVPLPWTWGAAVAVELFGARLALVNFVRMSSSSASYHRDRCKRHPMASVQQPVAAPQDLGNQLVSLRNGCLILGSRAPEYHPPAPLSIRHAARRLVIRTTVPLVCVVIQEPAQDWISQRNTCSEPSPGRPRDQCQDTQTVSAALPLHGELHVASLSGRPSHRRQDTLIKGVFCSTLTGSFMQRAFCEGLAIITWQHRAACNVELIRRLVIGQQYLWCAWSFRGQHRIWISWLISCSAQPFTGRYT